MAGFFKSVISGFAVSALVNGVNKAAASANRAPETQMPPANYQLPQTSPQQEEVPLYEQRIFGTPGASLLNAYSLDWEARQAGIDGEARVAAELERLAAFYPNTYIFHSVKLPGKIGDIDHLVVQGNKMLIVDSKNWKHDAAYHIFHSTFEADFITRNGEEFEGGEIHLTRQIAEWQVEFMDSSLDVQGVLVIANRKSTVSESINAPYSLANITGLATIFGNLFNEDGANTLHPLMLHRIIALVQQVQTAQPSANYAGSASVRKPSTRMTKWLVAWSFFNYTVMLLLFPLAGFSAMPLLFVTHRHQAYVKKNQLGGAGLLTAVLVFTYILLVGWAVTISIVVMNWTKTGLFF
jgi:hypothetical protein